MIHSPDSSWNQSEDGYWLKIRQIYPSNKDNSADNFIT